MVYGGGLVALDRDLTVGGGLGWWGGDLEPPPLPPIGFTILSVNPQRKRSPKNDFAVERAAVVEVSGCL